ncbi:hypothetical protein [Qipengyuania sediminis]|uniref:hypothetical protein n=1 Tax=Qipengyuania sediminis TaxID=1532023 RepID=UPI00105A0B91|nr:hypothetical protein [Qipengyuania sediminis]
MSALDSSEVRPGLVVHIDTSVLRSLHCCETNAEVKDGYDRAVVGPHYFLVIKILGDIALAVPLFSKTAPGNELLREELKSGLADKWIGEPSYFSRWQHWRIPPFALAAASAAEESGPNNRRAYATQAHEAIGSIGEWATKNRCEWRKVS